MPIFTPMRAYLLTSSSHLRRPTSAYKRSVFSSKCNIYPVPIRGNSGLQINTQYRSSSPTGISYNWTKDTNYILEGYPDVYVNGVKIGTASKGTASDDYVFTLFAYNDNVNPANESFLGRGKLYFMRIYGNDHELLLNLIPCINSSGDVGLYDTVHGSFFSSADGWTAINPLIAGPEVVQTT